MTYFPNKLQVNQGLTHFKNLFFFRRDWWLTFFMFSKFANKVGRYFVGILINSDFSCGYIWHFHHDHGHTFFFLNICNISTLNSKSCCFLRLIFRISVLTLSLSVFTSICVQRLSDFLSYFYENIFHSYLRCWNQNKSRHLWMATIRHVI